MELRSARAGRAHMAQRVLGVTAFIVAGCAACAGSGSPDLVALTVRSATAIHSARFTMRGTLAYQRQPVAFTARGSAAGLQLLRMRLRVAGSTGPLRVVGLAHAVYLSQGNGWFRAAPYEARAIRLLDPALYLTALQATNAVTLLNQSGGAGARVDHVALHLSNRRVAGIFRREHAQFGGFIPDVRLKMQAWVTESPLRLQRLGVTLRSRSLSLVYHATIHLTTINTVVRVAEPITPRAGHAAGTRARFAKPRHPASVRLPARH